MHTRVEPSAGVLGAGRAALQESLRKGNGPVSQTSKWFGTVSEVVPEPIPNATPAPRSLARLLARTHAPVGVMLKDAIGLPVLPIVRARLQHLLYQHLSMLLRLLLRPLLLLWLLPRLRHFLLQVVFRRSRPRT